MTPAGVTRACEIGHRFQCNCWLIIFLPSFISFFFFFVQVNFENFPNTIALLFRLATAAGWNDILDGCMISPPECDINFGGRYNGNCGYPNAAPAYFSSFVAVTFLLIINMYVAIILDNLVSATEQRITQEDIDEFYTVWSSMDPKATQFLPIGEVHTLVTKLCPPLGIDEPDQRSLADLGLPVYEDHTCHCLDVLVALVRRTMGEVDVSGTAIQEIINGVEEEFKTRFPRRTRRKPVWDSQELFRATLTLQKAYRRFIQLRDQRRARLQQLNEVQSKSKSSISVSKSACSNLLRDSDHTNDINNYDHA